MLHEPGPKPTRTDLAVVGAGPLGLVTALTAARAGLSVTVHERAADFSAGAGWRAGGMLAPEIEAEVSSPALVELGRRAMDLWPDLFPGVERNGSLVVAGPREPGALDHFAAKTANHRLLGADELAALEPQVGERFRRALFYPSEGHLNTRDAYAGLAAALAEAGVPILFSWTGDVADLAAERVVDARGLGARDRFPELRGVKGEMALIRCREIAIRRPVRLLHHRHPLYVVPRADGVYMIGATTIETDVSDTVTLRSAGELLTQAYALHPAFAEAEVLEFNAGLRPAFPDNEPRIVEDGRLVAVNGLYRHGWLIAPALAEAIVNLITDRSTPAHARDAQR
ncbi:glycine oxidase ThiO [Oharaeibacter diazotrophicus]|uniref:Glycine oxidase n=1 Tax=Oharaeibacter diazotrophicus TaxID=1920512 RepID=A0A4R6RNE4_9HYPH|nr:glycine oxidase ThiO [Oharaeibacter diazotrophicus]TDP87695.1 glycine oxidase [Oharaeibacter diazotrophicus]BBE74722.1 glycine oxidase [Pleomorphomonas sp. SM30]GLS77104.1 glycine oxidase [Oharaeibacter diazotrophicus]